MTLLLASNNSHKAKEFNEIFDKLIPGKVELVLPNQISNENLEVVEDGDTFIANSLIKAKAYYDKFKIPVISDDSGLEVDALNGAPGIHSARYAGEHGDDAANRKKLLIELKNNENKRANFIACLCFYSGNEPVFFEGKVFGNIISEEKGEGGFGYDPIFIPEGYDETFAEMDQSEKNKISHRSLALQRFCEWIEENGINEV